MNRPVGRSACVVPPAVARLRAPSVHFASEGAADGATISFGDHWHPRWLPFFLRLLRLCRQQSRRLMASLVANGIASSSHTIAITSDETAANRNFGNLGIDYGDAPAPYPTPVRTMYLWLGKYPLRSFGLTKRERHACGRPSR